MKFLTPFALSATASTALAAVLPQQAPLVPSIVQNAQSTQWLIELAPYQTRWVTEEEKWALKLVSRSSWSPASLMQEIANVTTFFQTGRSQLH